MGKPNSQWFGDVLGGSNGKPSNLLYIDKKKIATWSRSLGPQLPTELDYVNNPLLHNIPNEDDFVKLKNENPTMYQQNLGATSWDEAGRATITLMQKADASTLIHESGHALWNDIQRDIATEQERKTFEILNY